MTCTTSPSVRHSNDPIRPLCFHFDTSHHLLSTCALVSNSRIASPTTIPRLDRRIEIYQPSTRTPTLTRVGSQRHCSRACLEADPSMFSRSCQEMCWRATLCPHMKKACGEVSYDLLASVLSALISEERWYCGDTACHASLTNTIKKARPLDRAVR